MARTPSLFAVAPQAILLLIACCAISAQTPPRSQHEAPAEGAACGMCGLYEVTPGWVIGIARDGSDLVYQDFHSGRLGVLQPRDEGTASYSSGPTLTASSPQVAMFRFIDRETRRFAALQIQENGRPLRTANRVDFDLNEIAFQSGKTRLTGTVVSRQAAGRRPGLVLIPGGGPQGRDHLQSSWWAYNGFRVLTYDKRGVGGSQGDYREEAIPQLAEDAVSAVATLQSDRLTDSSRVGIVGHSEGGFVAPVVAARLRDLAFVIVLAAPLRAMPDQVVHEIASGLTCEGVPADRIAKATSLRRALNEAVLQNKNWEGLRRDITAGQGEPWFRAARVRPEWKTASQTMIERTRRYLDFDPSDYWDRVGMPVLAIYGEVDKQVASDESQRVLALDRHPNRTLHTYAKANHIFLEADTGCDNELSGLSRIVPGYFQTLVAWAARQVRPAR